MFALPAAIGAGPISALPPRTGFAGLALWPLEFLAFASANVVVVWAAKCACKTRTDERVEIA